MDFQPKTLNFEMVLDSIYVSRYYSSQTHFAKNSTNNLSFEVLCNISNPMINIILSQIYFIHSNFSMFVGFF
jgi:hypothetical protein